MPKLKTPDISFTRLPFVYLLVPLILGILAQHFWPTAVVSTVLVYGVLSATFLLGGFIFLFQQKDNRLYSVQIGALFVCLFCFGILAGESHDIRHTKSWFGHQTRTATAFVGQINDNIETKARTILIPIKITKARIGDHWEKSTGDLLLYLYQQDSMPLVKMGDELILPNKLVRIKNRGNPFEFDYAAYLHRRNLYYEAFLGWQDVTVINRPFHQPNFIHRLRKRLLVSIHQNIKDTATEALTEAMLLNDRSLLTNDIRRAYSITGIAHIIAISGMHVSLLFGIILGVLFWIKSPRWRWIKYLLGLPVIWLYIAITGFPPSAVRAAVMFTLLFLGLAAEKGANPLNLLAVTAFVLLCIEPQWLFGTGIQLSFAAVASIFLFFKPIHNLWNPKSKVMSRLWSIISVSLAVQILVFPVVMLYFHQFPLWFLLANIPAAGYSVCLMIMALLLFALSAVGVPCLWLGKLMTVMTHLFHGFIFYLAAHTPTAMLHLYLTANEFWLLMLAMLCLCLFIFFKKTFYVISALLFFCFLMSFSIFKNLGTMRRQRVVVYHTKGSVIDYFDGKTCFTMAKPDEKEPSSVFQYVLIPSRLGFNVDNIRQAHSTTAFKIISGKRILFLNQKLPKLINDFPVDYLIVSDSCTFQPNQWQQHFHPTKIILDGSFPRWKAQKWTQQLSKNGLMVYNVSDEGAWIFPPFLRD